MKNKEKQLFTHCCRKLSFCRDYALFGGHFLLKFGGEGHKNILYDRDCRSPVLKLLYSHTCSAGMHAEMTFVAQAIKAHMPAENNMVDECSLSKLKARIGKDGLIHNEKPKIVSNDSSYEQHKQFYEGVGRMFGQNLFANFDRLHPQKLDDVKTKQDALNLVLEMWSEYGVTDHLFYNPNIHDPDKSGGDAGCNAKEGEDDLFIYARDVFIRYLLILGFEKIEKYSDAEGWLSLRITLILAYLGNNLNVQASKYAKSTLFDVVLQLSSSRCTQERMRKQMCINKSGRCGGAVCMDRFCEWSVKKVKVMLRSMHSKADALLLEKELGALNMLSTVVQHDNASMLQMEFGKKGSNDFLKEEGRNIIEEQVTIGDPFNRKRSKQHKFRHKPRGSPYAGLRESEVERFLMRKKEEYRAKYY